MCNTAAFLTDRVLPDQPIRQWVLSVPFNLRFLLASRAEVFTAITRIFIEETLGWYQHSARGLGIPRARGGAVSVQHRFGGALNLNCHVHAVLIDGVFTRNDFSERASFHPVPPPGSDALELIIQRIHRRVLAWLRRRDLIAEHDYELERDEPSALEACVRASLSPTGLVKLGEHDVVETADRSVRLDATRAAPRKKGKHGLEALGFNLHAGVRIEAGDRVGRERLLRYCTRAPLSLERLSLLRDGRVAYELQRPWRRGETHRVMQPIELLARLSALVPAPRHPLVRFHGVLAPHSSWRRCVVPELCLDENNAGACVDEGPSSEATLEYTATKLPGVGIDRMSTRCEPLVPGAPTEAVMDAAWLVRRAKPSPFESGKARYSSGIWRIDWATLLKRVYDLDALACPCGGRLKFVEVVTDAERARTLLEQLGLRAAPPPVARARSPTVDPELPSSVW